MANVGDIAHVAHLIPQMGQVSEEDVESDGGAGVAEMCVAVDRRTADIHSDPAFV